MGCCGDWDPGPEGTLSPAYYPIEQVRGDNLVPFVITGVYWDGVQVTIVSAKAQVRKRRGDSGDPVLEIATTLMGGGTSVKVCNWEELTVGAGCYAWDLELVVTVDGGNRKLTYMAGPFSVEQQVTQ